MRTYSIPPDTRDKEKIIGGKMTLSQFIFLVGGVIIGGGLGLLFYKITGSFVAMIIGLILGVGASLPFAVFKKRKMGDMEYAKYLLLKYKFNKKVKKQTHINENYQRFAKDE